jgi:hypothetical protein
MSYNREVINTDDIVESLKKMSNDKFDIEVKDCNMGYFLNPLNKKWLSQRIYVSLKKECYINPVIIKEIVSRLNLKTLLYDKEVYYGKR